MIDTIEQRLTLEPHVGKRLFVEGVLIDINQPNKKNHHTFGLVFASIQLPNEKIELDHVVIPVKKDFIGRHNITLFKKYKFTAMVDSYFKTKKILGISTRVKAYQLTNINKNKFVQCLPDNNEPLSIYIQNRLRRLQSLNLPICVDELALILKEKPQGEREQYLNQLTSTLQKVNVTQADIQSTLYL